MSRRAVILAVLVVAVLKNLFNPQTFLGAVFTTAVGAGVAWLIGWFLKTVHQAYVARTSLDGRYAPVPIDEAIRRRTFLVWDKRCIIQEGHNTIRFGVRAQLDLALTQVNIRPVERNWYRVWKNQEEPFAVEFTKVTCRQDEHEHRGGARMTMNSTRADTKAGWDVLLPVPLGSAPFTLEKTTVLWFEIELRATRGWEGATALRANVLNGPQLLCRQPLKVIGDHNLVTR